MGKLGTFFAGFILGGFIVYMSLHYHFVYANDGVHMIPKISSKFAETYVDIRSFGLTEWTEHDELAFAIARAGKEHLIQGATTQAIQNSINRAFERLNLPTADAQTNQSY